MFEATAILGGASRKYVDRILIVCPRVADAVAYAGELLQCAIGAEWDVRLLLLTEGSEGRLRVTEEARERAAAALIGLGVVAESVRYCDVPASEVTEDLLARQSRTLFILDDEMKRFQPTLIVAPSRRDANADYSAIGVAVEREIVRQPSAPAGLAFISHGGVKPAMAVDLFYVPADTERRERKRNALSLCGHDAGGSCGSTDCERFLAVPGTPLDTLRSHSGQDPLLVRTAARALRNSRTLCLLPADHYLDPTEIHVGVPGVQVALGGRAADALAIEKAGHGVEFRFSAPHGPVWIKGCGVSGPAPGGQGWRRIETLPRQHSGSDAVCCAVHCVGTPARCKEVLAKTSRLADVVVAIDYGVSDEMSDQIREVSRTSRDLRVIVVPRCWGTDKALLTAMRYALLYLAFDSFISLDAEGNQDPSRIPDLVSATKTSGAELAIAAVEGPPMSPLGRLKSRLFQGLLRGVYPHAPACAESSFRCHSRSLVARAIESLDDDDEEAGLRILAMALDQGPVAEVCCREAGRDAASALYQARKFRALLQKVTALLGIAISKSSRSRCTATSRQRLSGRGCS